MSPQLLVGVIGVSMTLLVQFGGIVWFASSIRTSMMYQIQAVDKLTKAVEDLHSTVSHLDRRVTILETLNEAA